MRIWDKMRHTGQRDTKAFVFREIPQAGIAPGTAGPALMVEQDYFRVWLCEIFLGTRSTLLADWLPAAHARVSVTRPGRTPLEFSKVVRPQPGHLAQGVRLNYPLTDLIPYKGGVVEIEAALVAWQQANRIDVAVELLQAVSALPVPSVAPALAIAAQVTTAARDLVRKGDGAVHLDLHQAFVSSENGAATAPETGNILRPTYMAVLLADENEVSPGTLRVVNSQLCQLGTDGKVRHLLGWDFLLLRVEARSAIDDFWLPEMEELLDKAIAALEASSPTVARHYRSAAIAVAWRSPLFTWSDRDRIIGAIKARFDEVADRGLGAAPARRPESLTAMVEQYGPTADQVHDRGRMTEANAFAL